jgi:hypothetical protein
MAQTALFLSLNFYCQYKLDFPSFSFISSAKICKRGWNSWKL